MVETQGTTQIPLDDNFDPDYATAWQTLIEQIMDLLASQTVASDMHSDDTLFLRRGSDNYALPAAMLQSYSLRLNGRVAALSTLPGQIHDAELDQDAFQTLMGASGIIWTYSIAGSHVKPRLDLNNFGIRTNTGGTDPTNSTHTFQVSIADADTLQKGMVVAVRHRASEASFSRRIYMYEGDAGASGTALVPISGAEINESQTEDVVTRYRVEDDSQALYLYNSRQSITGIWVEGAEGLAREFDVEPFTGLAPTAAGKWYDVATFGASQSGNIGILASDTVIRIDNGTDIVERMRFSSFCNFGSSKATINFKHYHSDWAAGQGGTKIRFLYDTSDMTGPSRLQLFLKTTDTLSGRVYNWLPVPHDPTGEWGSMDPYTETGNELVIEELDLAGLPADISRGSSGGIRVPTIAGPGPAETVLDLTSGNLEIKEGGAIVADITPSGMRLNAGDYAPYTQTQTPPFTSGSAMPDITVNHPIRDVVMATAQVPLPSGAWTRAELSGNWVMRGSGGTNPSELSMVITGVVPGERISGVIQQYFNASNPNQHNWEIVNLADNSVVGAFVSSGVSPGFVDTPWTLDVPSSNSDGRLELRLRPGTGNHNFAEFHLYNWSLTAQVIEPELHARAVAQFDAYDRGLVLPNVIPNANNPLPLKAVGVDMFNPNNLLFGTPAGDATLSSIRPNFAELEYGIFFTAGLGAPQDQGWTGTNSTRGDTIAKDGFPAAWHPHNTTEDSGTGQYSLIAPDNTDEMWAFLHANGFEATYRLYFTRSSTLQINIEMRTAGVWPAGRATILVQDVAGQEGVQFEITDGGSTVAGPFACGELHIIEFIWRGPAAVDQVEIWVDKVYQFDRTISGFDGDRGMFIWDNDPNNRDWEIQSISLCALTVADTDRTYTIQELASNYRDHIPNVSFAGTITRRIPKGLHRVGRGGSIVNGSNQIVRLTGEDGDKQIFNGAHTYVDIPPGQQAFYNQVSPILGCDWSVSLGPVSQGKSKGHWLELAIDAAGSIKDGGRDGNYFGDDVTSSLAATGHYEINIGPALFIPESVRVTASVNDSANPDGWEITASRGGTGQIAVRTYRNGAPANTDYTVRISW